MGIRLIIFGIIFKIVSRIETATGSPPVNQMKKPKKLKRMQHVYPKHKIQIIMFAAFVQICNRLADIREAISGVYQYNDSELEDIEVEIFETPLPKSDKVNLSNDRKNVWLDYKKAVDEKKFELSR